MEEVRGMGNQLQESTELEVIQLEIFQGQTVQYLDLSENEKDPHFDFTEISENAKKYLEKLRKKTDRLRD
jgi:cyclopropane fatty-acyl-phospholipid synthase-like methyltransferase